MSSEPASPAPHWAATVRLTLYYLAILLSVVALHANSSFKAPPFIYADL
jgi:hypothetical protein